MATFNQFLFAFPAQCHYDFTKRNVVDLFVRFSKGFVITSSPGAGDKHCDDIS